MAQITDPKELSERAQWLFKCLVERYITDGQPVSSRALARDANLDLSPATVRNVMADLEELGLLQAPHTSSGRVPTVQGYRLFVDSMLQVRSLPAEDVRRIASDLEGNEDVQAILRKTSAVLSDVTRLAGLVMVPRQENQSLRQIEFLPLDEQRVLAIMVMNSSEVQNRIIRTDRTYSPEELQQAANYLNAEFGGKDIHTVRRDLLREMAAVREQLDSMMQTVIEMAEKALVTDEPADDYVLAGETNLMHIGELSDLDKLRQLFEAFGHKRDIMHLLEQALAAQGVQIFIGEESGYEALGECSVVTSTYEAEGVVLGVLGVIGPTRMAYERVIPIVDLTAKVLGTTLKSLH